METGHQLIVRIKSFLNSTELLDSPTARDLYHAYCALNSQAAERLLECEVLLRKKQKIEAVILVQQEPNLFETLELLLFPERSQLLLLADLYDWPLPPEINLETISQLKKAVAGMDDLRPLLTEFRRIARTNQLKNKLHLLREILRIDKGNPEWRVSLAEIENQYVSQLIAEAQNVIQNNDFVRLEQINDEFRKSPWVITIPTIVLQKIEKILANHHREEAKKNATALLERINNAYAAFDITELEDALLCWRAHCENYNYSPDENEKIQLKEASEYLKSEQQKQKTQQEFQTLIDRITALIDAAEPLAEVERLFAKAQSSEQEIPDYLAKRVENYRADVERERRAAILLKALKIVGSAAVILLVIGSVAVWGIQALRENSLAANLNAAIREGRVVEAQTMLKDIETRYPKLAAGPNISKVRAALRELEVREEARIAEFARLVKELDELKRQSPPDPSLKDKLAALERAAKTDDEQERVKAFRTTFEDAALRFAEETEEQFLKKIAVLSKYRTEVLQHIKENEFALAEAALAKFETLLAEISKLQGVNKNLLADHKDLLSAGNDMREILTEKKTHFEKIRAAYRSILNAEDLATLEDAIRSVWNALDSKEDAEEYKSLTRCLKEIAYFKAILAYQSDHDFEVPKEYAKNAFFADAQARKEYAGKCAAAKDALGAAIDNLQKNTNRQKIIFIRVKSGTSLIDLYAVERGFSSISDGSRRSDISFKSVDGTKITLSGFKHRFNMKIGDEEYSDCQLVYPAGFTVEALKASRARHQELIEQFFSEIHSVAETDLLKTGVKYLKLIREDRWCAPYWKMKLSLRIVEPLLPIDLSPEKQLSGLRDELKKLEELDNAVGDPLANKFLAEKTALFFRNFDPSLLEKNLAQNEFMLNIASAPMTSRLVCFGVALRPDKQFKYAICSNVKNTSAEIFCFDPQTSGCLLVGRYGKNGLLIDEKFREKILGHLLFVSIPDGLMTRIARELHGSRLGLDPRKIRWPEFWPQNMRGNAK